MNTIRVKLFQSVSIEEIEREINEFLSKMDGVTPTFYSMTTFQKFAVATLFYELKSPPQP